MRKLDFRLPGLLNSLLKVGLICWRVDLFGLWLHGDRTTNPQSSTHIIPTHPQRVLALNILMGYHVHRYPYPHNTTQWSQFKSAQLHEDFSISRAHPCAKFPYDAPACAHACDCRCLCATSRFFMSRLCHSVGGRIQKRISNIHNRKTCPSRPAVSYHDWCGI